MAENKKFTKLINSDGTKQAVALDKVSFDEQTKKLTLYSSVDNSIKEETTIPASEVDITLSKSGLAADAKITGNAIKDVVKVGGTASGFTGIIVGTGEEEIELVEQKDFDAEIAKLNAKVGTPLVANAASAMVDTTKIYVYTGNENGYVNGNWYFYNGTNWESGGVYNAVAVQTDKTLTQENKAADAKKTGDDISELKEDLDATTCSVISVTHGKYLTGNGVETTGDYPNYCIVYFDVADLDDLHVNVRANTDSESTRFVFYDSENAILQIIRPTLNSDDYNQYSIPTGASKFGVTVLTAKLKESFAVVNVKSVNERLNGVVNNLYDEKLNGTLIAGKYVNYNTGSFDSYAGWSMTDYLDVSSYEELLIYTPKATQYVAFYDSGKNHITYDAQSMNLKKGLSRYSVPQNAKYYVVSNTDAAMAGTVIYSHYGENQGYIETSINAVNGDYLFSLFNKVVCIGDSLTRGYRYEYPEGSKNADYGYPEYLAHMTNSDVSNYGQSGDDPTEWYEYYENTDFSSYDCALICFGRNGYLLSEIDRTNYQNIITKLKTENPHMTIFILSVPPSDVDGTGNNGDGVVINVKIKAIADANNLPYIDLLTNSDVQNNSYRSDGVHYYTLGYLLLAREIMRRVDLFIFENQSEFMQTWVPSTKPPYPPAQ